MILINYGDTISLNSAPKIEGHTVIWIPKKEWDKKYKNIDLLMIEERGLGQEFLRKLDLEGFKICSPEDVPGYPHKNGFVMFEDCFLCKKES